VTEADFRQGASLRSSGDVFADSDDEGEGDDTTAEGEAGGEEKRSRMRRVIPLHQHHLRLLHDIPSRPLLPLDRPHLFQAASLFPRHPGRVFQHLNEIPRSPSSTPHLVAPASPKSVYRLAHFLGLADLRLLARRALHTSLTPGNILTELFSDVSVAYPEIADVMLEAAADLWEKVKEGKAVEEMERQLEEGIIELPAALVWKLTKLPKGRLKEDHA
jgi:hypothetical protein